MHRDNSHNSLNSYSLTSYNIETDDFDDESSEKTPFLTEEKQEKKKEKKKGHGHGHGHGHSHKHDKEHKHKEHKHDGSHSESDRDIESLEIVNGSFKKEKKHKEGHKHKDGHKHGHSHKHGHGHDHDDEHDDHEDAPVDPVAAKKAKDEAQKRAKTALLIATVFTMIFMVLEIVGGYIAGSLAIMTDAAHLLTDVAAMLLSLVAMHLASRPANKSHTFGYHRAEILGAALSVITIWALVAVLAYEAILRLLADSRLVGEIVNGKIMTVIGIAGFCVNIVDALILKWGNAPHGHSHSHGHSHGGHGHHENINVRSAFIHVIGDCLQSVGVIIAALFVWIGNQVNYGSPSYAKSYWNLADPIASLLFGIVTLGTTFKIMKNIVNVLMERVPEHVDYDAIQSQLEAIPGVKKVHDLHIWELSLGKVSLSAHIAADEHVESLIAAQKICTRHQISHVTIQIDHPMAPCETTTIH